MKMQLIEMVQDILNDMDSDEVNSFSDTTEAFQVAQIIKTTFFEIMTRKEWPHLQRMSQLESLGDSTKPNYLKVPTEVVELKSVTYNAALPDENGVLERDKFRNITYLYPDQFMRKVNQRNTDNDNVVTVAGFDGVRLLITNDRAPQYWTSFDDQHIVFDSYNADVGTTMLGTESQALMRYSTTWLMEDTFVPDLPVDAFPALLSEAKSVAFIALKQVANEKAEQQSVRQHNMLAQRGWVAQGGVRYPNYGRGSSKQTRHDRPIFDSGSYTGGK